jgi:cytochrome c oxidase cbb3-type subunit III
MCFAIKNIVLYFMRVVLLILIFVHSVFGQEPGPATIGGGRQDPAAVARGKKLFAPMCGFCHGEDARGRSAPDLVRSALVLDDIKGNLIGDVLRTGRPPKGMPAFAVSQGQILDIAAFLHSQTHAAADRFSYEIKGVVTGDPRAGQAIFEGQGKCSTCHSTTGDLAHVANKYNPVELQQRLLMPPSPSENEPSTQKRTAAEVTLTLPSGESVSGKLIFADEFDVALCTSSGWYRSYPRAGSQVQIRDPLQVHRESLHRYSDAEMHNLLAYLETMK